MANSILSARSGPLWPLGFIKVVTAGTPVNIMSVVDPTGLGNPNTPCTPGSAVPEYGFRAQQIILWGYQPSTGPAYIPNTGNVYVLLAPDKNGSGNASDTGVLVAIIQPGTWFDLASAPTVSNKFGPYSFFIDADNDEDGVMPVLLIQGD
jgi:hypothetical protein